MLLTRLTLLTWGTLHVSNAVNLLLQPVFPKASYYKTSIISIRQILGHIFKSWYHMRIMTSSITLFLEGKKNVSIFPKLIDFPSVLTPYIVEFSFLLKHLYVKHLYSFTPISIIWYSVSCDFVNALILLMPFPCDFSEAYSGSVGGY